MDEMTIKRKMTEYIRNEIMKNPEYPLKEDEPLISGGLIDSFSLVHIAVFIEKEIGVKLPDTDLNIENMDTIQSMSKRIMAEIKQ